MLSKCGSYKDYGSRGPCCLSRNRGHSFIHYNSESEFLRDFENASYFYAN